MEEKQQIQHNNWLTSVVSCGKMETETTKTKVLFDQSKEEKRMQNEYEIKKEMCEIGRRVYNRGMVAANDGNFSVKLNDKEFLCTPTGVSKGFMTPEYICKVDAEGNVLQANKGFRPSSEIKMHMRVYKERPDVNSVVHAHPLYATTFAICGIPLTQPIMPEAVIALGCVPIAKYGTPSTMEIPDAVSEHLQHFDAVLLENHGALAYSDSLLNAYHKMESLEFYARLLYQSRMLGEPQEFNKEQMDKLYDIRREMGLSGKHPADVCPNAKAGRQSCHSCGGGHEKTTSAGSSTDADLVASITKKVMDQLGL